jgi:uncharacterized protein (TIGR03067 family)
MLFRWSERQRLRGKSRGLTPGGTLTSSAMRVLTLVLIGNLLVMNGCSNAGLLSVYSADEDAKKMQGSWKLTGATFNGESMFDDARLTIDDEQYTMTVRGIDTPSTFKLGIGGPHTIRVFHHENPLASQGFYGGTFTGIYELSGDRLRICFDMTGRQYPKTFDASKGSRRSINEFVREKSH